MSGDQLPFDALKRLTEQLDVDFALQAAGLGIWEVDPATYQVVWDDRCRQLFGLAQDNQLSYQQTIHYIHSEDRDRVDQAARWAMNPQSDGIYDQTYRTLGADDGQLRWVRFHGRSYFTQAGELVRFAGIAQEVTQEVLAQLQTREARNETERQIRLFEAIASSTPDLLYVFDLNYRFTYVNQALLTMWGSTWEKSIGKGLLENGYEPWHAQMHEREIDQVVATKQPVRGEVSFPHATLGNRIYDYVFAPIINKKGEVEAIAGSTRDITEIRNSTLALSESETRFRTMAEASPILIAVGDQTSNATYFNKAWTLLTGRPMDDLLRFGWVDLVHPDDRQRYLDSYLDAFAIRESFTGEFRVLTPSGAYRWLLAQGTARFQSDGSFAGYISACVDITERKQAEEQQRHERLALERAYEQARLSKEAAQLGTFDMDLEKGTMIWDERCRILFGISHSRPVAYETDFVPNLHPDDRQRVVNIINDVFNKAVSNGDYDVDYRTVGVDDQQIRWVRAKGKAYFNDQDKPIRFIGSVLDITPQIEARQQIEQIVADRTRKLKVANQQLRESNELLVRSNENLQRFGYVASHDLQEPLRKIQQFGDLLQIRYADSQGDELFYVQRMQSAASRMSTLIRDLLSFSRISIQSPTDTPVSLQKVMAQILQELDHRVAETGARVAVGHLPTLKGDALQLRQLLQNLLSNALKFHRAGVVPVIEVTCQAVSAASLPASCRPARLSSSYCQIDVRDNGIGFEQKYVDRIFEVFQRLHSQDEYMGTGIGLAICEKVVANHGGAITATSQVGQGTTFTIYLPV